VDAGFFNVVPLFCRKLIELLDSGEDTVLEVTFVCFSIEGPAKMNFLFTICARWPATTSVNLLGFTPTGASKYFLILRVPSAGLMLEQTQTFFLYLRIVQKLEGKAKLMAILSKSSSHSHAVVRTRILTSFEFLAKTDIFCYCFAGQASAAGGPKAHGMLCSFFHCKFTRLLMVIMHFAGKQLGGYAGHWRRCWSHAEEVMIFCIACILLRSVDTHLRSGGWGRGGKAISLSLDNVRTYFINFKSFTYSQVS
jgi:hypothetical protein